MCLRMHISHLQEWWHTVYHTAALVSEEPTASDHPARSVQQCNRSWCLLAMCDLRLEGILWTRRPLLYLCSLWRPRVPKHLFSYCAAVSDSNRLCIGIRVPTRILLESPPASSLSWRMIRGTGLGRWRQRRVTR